ncbi:MAG: sugar phosphate isomerase/epimerase [Lentisphaeria bacterium]|nr:sugar phosphate isomerase/epimerase [Lentisphaeria bacterium]
MAKQNSVMEIGVLSSTRTEGNPFDAIVRHGVHVTQLTNWNMDLCTPEFGKRVKKWAKDSQIRLNSLWAGYSGNHVWNFTEGPVTLGIVPPEYREQRVADLIRGAELAASCGAPAIATHCGFIPENPTDPLYPGVLDAIGKVASRCAELGLGFWFETGQETPVTLLRVLEDLNMDNLGINFDTGNIILYGKGNPVDAVAVFGKYVRNLHVKDGLPPTTGRDLGQEVPVGKGLSNYPKLLPALYAAGYRGDLIIEREISGEQQIKDIRKTIVYLGKYVAKTLEKAAK